MASRAYASTFQGMACPNRLSYGKVHGPQGAVGTAEFEGNLTFPLGQKMGFQAGASSYIGFVTKVETRQNENDGEVTTVRLVDWRDRLHDNYIYAAWNMQEEDGRFWHLLPNDWRTQRKTWIARPVGQQDFSAVQAVDPATGLNVNTFAADSIFSAYTLLKYIAYLWGFKVTAEQHARDILTRSYLTNLDFSNGVKIIEAVDTICRRCGLQFTCFGSNRMHITLRGYSDNVFVNALVNGYTNICFSGASEGSFGYELNDKGRRVHVIGGPNKYEFTFPCRIDWNPAFTFELCFGGWALSSLLQSLGLTLASKLKEMPDKYHDHARWEEGETARRGAIGHYSGKLSRNEMAIEDYINRYCYRSYVVDFQYAFTNLELNTGDEIKGEYDTINTEDLTLAGGPTAFAVGSFDVSAWNTGINTPWPISRTLVTNSNINYVIYATSQKMIRGEEDPFGKQSAMVPMDRNGSLSIEEILETTASGKVQSAYVARISFSEPQFFRDMKLEWDDPKQIQPDYVAVQLALEKELFAVWFGQNVNGPKVRTQKVTLRNLYRGFVTGQEMLILQQNFISDLVDLGRAPTSQPVKAEDIAKRIAWQALFHQYVNRAGHLTFDDSAGYEVDGLIDAVNVSFSDDGGITETINFTSEFMDDENGPSFSVVKVSTFLKTEEEIIRDRLVDYSKKALKDPALGKRALSPHDKADSVYKGIFSAASSAKAFGHDGVVSVILEKDDVNAMGETKPGNVFVLGADQV